MFDVVQKDINRLEITMGGKLNSEQMKTALDQLVTKSKTIEKGTLLFDLVDFHLPTLGAIAIEFSRVPNHVWMDKKIQTCSIAKRSGMDKKDW